MSVEMRVRYWGEPVLGGKFIGKAVLTWATELYQDDREFRFDTPFDTQEAAADNAKQRMVEAFGSGQFGRY